MRGGRAYQAVQERRRQTEPNPCGGRLLVFDRIAIGRRTAERALGIISTELEEQERNQHSG